MREDWLGCCSGGGNGRGLGARASALPGFTVLCSTRPGTAGGVQGVGAEGTVLRDRSPPMGPAALCRLETPAVPARWATSLGRQARSLLKPQQPQSKWTQLPGHRPDTLPPALLAPRGGRKGLPRRGIPGTHNRRQIQVQAQGSPAPQPYGRAGVGSRSDIGSWETGPRDITFHANQASHPRAHFRALGFSGGATLDSKRNFILISETVVKSRPFPQPLCEPV